MWTSTVDLSPRRVVMTQLLGRFWRGAYFSSFAPLRVQNLPRQSLPEKTWVRVRNRLAGICGSDLHLIYVDGDLRIAPAAIPSHGRTYLGHEVVGEVIEVGDDVQYLQIGDRVVLQHGPNCLSTGVQPLCRSCATGNYGLCERGNLPGPFPIGAGWSEEMLLHEQQLFRVPNALTDEQAVLLEPTAVALHAVLRHPPQAHDRVLIIGAGTIGLLMLQVVRALAPNAEISVLARHPFQVEKATRLGAAHIIYPQDSYLGVQKATDALLYHGLPGNTMMLGGYDVIYDTIGTKQTIHDGLRWARANATVVLVGLSLHMMHVDLTPIWYQEVTLIGTFGHGIENWPIGAKTQRSTFSITAELMEQYILHSDELITHHFALNNYRDALLTAVDKGRTRAIKVVFDYSLIPPSVVPNVRASSPQQRPFIPPDLHEPLPELEDVQPVRTSTPTKTPLLPTQQQNNSPLSVFDQPTRSVRQEPATPMISPASASVAPASETQDISAMPTTPVREHMAQSHTGEITLPEPAAEAFLWQEEEAIDEGSETETEVQTTIENLPTTPIDRDHLQTMRTPVFSEPAEENLYVEYPDDRGEVEEVESEEELTYTPIEQDMVLYEGERDDMTYFPGEDGNEGNETKEDADTLHIIERNRPEMMSEQMRSRPRKKRRGM